jgi:hypothetical protein
MKRVALFLKESQIRKLKAHGQQIDRSVASVVRRAIDFYFEAIKAERK